jgi:hypothetical protein
MRLPLACLALIGLGATLNAPRVVSAQQSLAPISPVGQTVTPVFEGWYRNRDGTYSLSFGYFNRNAAEELDVPVGENNFLSPGAANQGQPTHFHPRRHWGVFAVTVPADFGEKKLVWTLTFRGQSYAIPGSLKPDWQIDAVEGEASADNTPPRVSIAGGPEAQGPGGTTTGPLRIAVGAPLALAVMAKDDARAEPIAKSAAPVDLTWFMHQGPGAVKFAPATAKLTPTGGTMNTTATFSLPGEYVLRVRANDAAVASAGHAQCCWTNAFVRVTVTP